MAHRILLYILQPGGSTPKTCRISSQTTTATCITQRRATTVATPSLFTLLTCLDPSPDSLVVHLNVSFPAPTVILDHSSFIANVALSGNTVTVTFTTPAALQHAAQNWNTYSELLLVTTAVSNNPQRDYLLVTLPIWNDLSVSFTAEFQHPSDTFHEFTVNWGQAGNQGSSGNNAPNHGSGNHKGPNHGSGNHKGPNHGSSGHSRTTTYGTSTTQSTSTTHSSTSASGHAACSRPTAPVIDGLPAAPCGYDFDDILDQNIGYYGFSGPHGSQDLSSFAPGVTGVVPSDLSPATKKKRALQALQRRSFGSWLRSVVHVGLLFRGNARTKSIVESCRRRPYSRHNRRKGNNRHGCK
jgi:hypothetical protein